MEVAWPSHCLKVDERDHSSWLAPPLMEMPWACELKAQVGYATTLISQTDPWLVVMTTARGAPYGTWATHFNYWCFFMVYTWLTKDVRRNFREEAMVIRAFIGKLEVARKASIVDEETRQQRAREIGVGTSNSVSTTDGAVRVDISTTEGAEMVDTDTNDADPIVDPPGSGKPDPPTC
uniref:Integrase core domain containing protein n=1 Tax=Solanum tuberosum TaxID=4113 RepID=M1DIP9_SOLTU